MAGSHQIWLLDLGDGRLRHYAGSGQEGIADGSLIRSSFSQPSGLSLAGNWLYVADAEDSGVRRIDLDRGQVETLVGTGLFDFGDRDGPFESALLQHVLGIAALDEGRILIADTYNHKLKLLNIHEKTVTTLAGTGAPGKGPQDGPLNQMNEPGGVAVLGDLVLIADTNNNRILQYDLNTDALTEWTLTELKGPGL
jgi:DNA-binding beta-propeller fold protein YncE